MRGFPTIEKSKPRRLDMVALLPSLARGNREGGRFLLMEAAKCLQYRPTYQEVLSRQLWRDKNSNHRC